MRREEAEKKVLDAVEEQARQPPGTVALSKVANITAVLAILVEFLHMAAYVLSGVALGARARCTCRCQPCCGTLMAGTHSNMTRTRRMCRPPALRRRLRLNSLVQTCSKYVVGRTTRSAPTRSLTTWCHTLAQAAYLFVIDVKEVAIMWGAVGAVAVLVAIVATQFFVEMRDYGLRLVKAGASKPPNRALSKAAHDSFMFSFTGGHGCGAPCWSVSHHARRGTQVCLSKQEVWCTPMASHAA